MQDAIVLRHDQHAISQLILNRPEKFNALSSEVMTLLQNHLDSIAQDKTIKVVIIKAHGKAFSAGHDLKEVRHREDKAFHEALFNQCSQMMLSINQLPQPVIAEVNGIATAAGCQLVANCDLAVASPQAKFAVSGINFGLFCSTPAVALSRNLSQKHALKMLLTGEFIDAQQALNYGLINDLVDESTLSQHTLAIAESIAAKPAAAIALGKAMFYKQLKMDLPTAYQYASETMACNMDTDHAREGIDAFLQKRTPNWSK
ncbi:enoyl-CoA hydratase [Ostreibacterium oceani]|uniref:Enoyl-CoA hydratase domain-containing protein 3, mitochondrial n=1 Tax=Ostreibacterium oceani TaxID=2654998 RepID=A0A6N7ETV4_9GAMM|nr:enoyl-CoA hydratase [Ostreibacterium oceani]MPV85981.1 enoyl-CoA hydratase [Ostreibacterium oceani]